MDGTTTMKLIIEKGPRAGETLTYPSTSLINIGRVVRGNTVAIKDSGISSKHLSIKFDSHLNKWTLIDLDSSNGTVLNGLTLMPHVPSVINDADRIKIGELTSILVKIDNIVQVEAVRPKRNVRRQGKRKPEPESESDAESDAGVVVKSRKLGLGLGFDGEKEGKEAVTKRNLRSSAKKEVETVSGRRTLRSFKKEEVSFVPELNEISENLNVDVTESVVVEPKKRRGRKKKVVEEEKVCVDGDMDKGKGENVGVVPVVGRVTRGRRKGLKLVALENAESSGLEENVNNVKESLQVDQGNEAAFDKLSVDQLEKVKDSCLEENVVSTQGGCEGNNVMVGESLSKGKEAVEESESIKDGCDNGRWVDLEKMMLGDFFDYLEVQLPKEIYDKSEKIIADLVEKARKCHEFRLQINESGKRI